MKSITKVCPWIMIQISAYRVFQSREENYSYIFFFLLPNDRFTLYEGPGVSGFLVLFTEICGCCWRPKVCWSGRCVVGACYER